MEVLHVLQAPLRAAAAARSDDGEQTWGQIVVARHRGLPYHDTEEQWLHLLAGYAAVVLENSFLQGQLGRIRQEADSIVLAGWTLASLPNPAAAMEMACRKILGTLDLHQVVIFLYRDDDGSGCHVITYPADGPTLTAQCSLRGRGLSLLQRFLDGGTALVINRRREYPDLFSAMGWDDPVQAAACFPLYVLQHRWGVLCLLAKTAGAFPAQTQQNLAIFSGEVAMALENSYLRQACARARNVQEEATKREEPAVRPHRSSQRLADSREGTREHQDRTATVEPARSPEKYLQYEEIPVHSGA
jgi:GAF domain-containing protein